MGVGLMGGAHGGWTDDKKGYIEAGDGDGISFQPVDPISKLELVDPCLASDGYIHDRWTVSLHSLSSLPRRRNSTDPSLFSFFASRSSPTDPNILFDLEFRFGSSETSSSFVPLFSRGSLCYLLFRTLRKTR